MKLLLSVAVAMVATIPAVAAEQAPPINIIFSGGNATCAAWIKSAGNEPVRQYYEMWVRGFVSGHNYAHPSRQVKVGTFPGGEELFRYFDQYCTDNPQQSFVAGTIQLVEQLAAPAKPAPVRKPPAKAPAAAK